MFGVLFNFLFIIRDVTDKKDDELFKIDVKPDSNLLLSAKERRLLKAKAPLRSEAALINTSKVKDPRGQRYVYFLFFSNNFS